MYSCLILATVLAFIKTHLYNIRYASTSLSIIFFLKNVVLLHISELLIFFFVILSSTCCDMRLCRLGTMVGVSSSCYSVYYCVDDLDSKSYLIRHRQQIKS